MNPINIYNLTPDDPGDEVFTLITGDAECVAEIENAILTLIILKIPQVVEAF